MEAANLFQDVHRTLSMRYPVDGANMPMSDWLVANTHYGAGRFSFEGYQFQMAIADDMHDNLACIKCSQVGLSLPLDTPIPTPTGWTTMGGVQIGEQIFDEQGRPTTVTFKSEIHTDHACYEIEFDDGTKMVADAEHRWFVKVNRHPFNAQGVFEGRGRPNKAEGYRHEGVVDTQFLFENQAKTKFYIPLAHPLELPAAELPLHPYVLGAWLGDGTRYSATLTIGDQDFKETAGLLQARGVTLSYSSPIQYRMVGQFGVLRRMGLIGEAKRIPTSYQRASVEQRLELLRGLMDTDGSITPRGRASFHNTEAGLVEDVQDLLHGLGYKTRTRWRQPTPTGFGGKKLIAEVSFVPDETPVFNLQRKRERQASLVARPRFTQNRTIVRVTPVETVHTQCLTVDAPSHLFLAGRAMVPTHNTETQIRKFFGWLKRNPNKTGIFTLPSEKLFKRISKMRIKPWLANEEVFNSYAPGDQKPSRSMDMYQIDSSFAVISGLTEDDATSTSADILFHDELDLSDMKMIDLAQSRLQNSDDKITQAFSTPKYPGYGIDGRFQISDQREYLYKCPRCNHNNIPDFDLRFLNLSAKIGYRGPENILEASDEQINQIKLDELHVKCEKCSRAIDMRDHSTRYWVARHPARDLVRGYRVLPFATHRIPPAYILGRLLAARRENAIGGFHNTVLGRAYVDGNSQLAENEIREAMKNHTPQEVGEDIPCFLGVDVGETCHLVCGPLFGQTGGTAIMRAVPIHQLYDVIAELHTKYNIVGGTIDRHPQSHVANSVRDRWPHIMPCEYRGTAALRLVKNESDEVTHCQVDRTDAIDRVVKGIREGTLQLNGYGAYSEILITHLRNMVREEEPETPAKWVKLAEDDHFFHALVFFLVAPRMLELLFDHTTSSMMTSAGVFDINDLVIDPSRPVSDFLQPEPSALSVRSRMKQKGQNLWRV